MLLFFWRWKVGIRKGAMLLEVAEVAIVHRDDFVAEIGDVKDRLVLENVGNRLRGYSSG